MAAQFETAIHRVGATAAPPQGIDICQRIALEMKISWFELEHVRHVHKAGGATADPALALNSAAAPSVPELPGAGIGLGTSVNPASRAPDLPAPENYQSAPAIAPNQAVYDPNLSITAGSENRATPAPPVLPPASPPAL